MEEIEVAMVSQRSRFMTAVTAATPASPSSRTLPDSEAIKI
jgi:hypothetical protein